ncbi:MAG TPA: ATP-binding cassette domain-containing protein, partial [Wenzhouxiangella sp.]
AGLGAWLSQRVNGLDLMLGPEGMGLSRGQIQRLCLARLLITPKPLLLLDEPTTGLDQPTETQLWSDLKDMAKRTGMTIVAASHSPLARDWCDVRWRIKNQRVVRI